MNPATAVAYVQLKSQRLFRGGIILLGDVLNVRELEGWAPLTVAVPYGEWHLIKCVKQGESWAARYEYHCAVTTEHE